MTRARPSNTLFSLLSLALMGIGLGMSQPLSGAPEQPSSAQNAAQADSATVQQLREQLELSRKQLEIMQKQFDGLNQTLQRLEPAPAASGVSGAGAPSLAPASPAGAQSGLVGATAPPLPPVIGAASDPLKVPVNPVVEVDTGAAPPSPSPPVAPGPTLPPEMARYLSPEAQADLNEALGELNSGLREAQAEIQAASEEVKRETTGSATDEAIEVLELRLEVAVERRQALLEELNALTGQLEQASGTERSELTREISRVSRELRSVEREVRSVKRELERSQRHLERAARRRSESGEDKISFGEKAIVKAGQQVKDLVVLKGDAEVYGEVTGDAVVMAGDLTVHDGGVVKGDAVVMAGEIFLEDGGKILGEQTRGDVPVPSLSLDEQEEASHEGFFEDAFGSFILYLLLLAGGLLSMTFIPQRVRNMADVISQRPRQALIAGGVTAVAFVPVSVVLGITLIGIPLIPILFCLLTLGGLVGVCSLAQVVGTRVPLRQGPKTSAGILAWGLGLLILASLTPILGKLLLLLAFVIGLGSAVLSRFGDRVDVV